MDLNRRTDVQQPDHVGGYHLEKQHGREHYRPRCDSVQHGGHQLFEKCRHSEPVHRSFKLQPSIRVRQSSIAIRLRCDRSWSCQPAALG